MSFPQSNFDDHDFDESLANDQDWRAFRYVADEMSGDERAAMEIELADDQSLREAVARMVAGLQLIDSSFAQGLDHRDQNSKQKVGLAGPIVKPVASTSSSFQRSMIMVTSIVAVLALLVGGSLLIPGSVASSDASQEMLAEMWVDSIGLANHDDEQDDEYDVVDVEFELMASSWLLDAFDETDLIDESGSLQELLGEPDEDSREYENLDEPTDEEAERV